MRNVHRAFLAFAVLAAVAWAVPAADKADKPRKAKADKAAKAAPADALPLASDAPAALPSSAPPPPSVFSSPVVPPSVKSVASVSTSPVPRSAQSDLRDAASVLKKQIAIVMQIQDVAKGMDVETPAENRIRTILYSLSSNELLTSSKLIEQLIAAKTSADAAKVRTDALAAQDRAIKVLQDIVGVVKLMDTQTKKDPLPPQGSDMPTEVRDKLEDLHKKLAEFLKEQKKVIETSTDLAKVPVDDLTGDQEQKLKDAAAVQDKWANFLEEKYTDLSKMPVQDASVASTCKQLAEIYSEVKMAKDALSE